MSKVLDVQRLEEVMKSAATIQFSLLFGSGRNGCLPKVDSDIDVAVYLDHKPDLEERLNLLGLIQDSVKTDRVDLVFLNATDNVTLQREALKGRFFHVVIQKPMPRSSLWRTVEGATKRTASRARGR